MNDKMLSERLVAYRKEKGLTQKELAETVNYSDKVISKWERGESTPNIDALKILSNFYNVTIDEMVSNNFETDMTKSKIKMLDVHMVKGPSLFLKLSVLIPVVLVIISFNFSIELTLIALIILLLYLLLYGYLITKVVFESQYKGNNIKIINRSLHIGLYINDKLVDANTSLFTLGLKLSGKIGDETVKVSISANLFVKCTIFIE